MPGSSQRQVRTGRTVMTIKHTVDPRLWLLLSPALPIGGYSYSQGLEAAQGAGLLSDYEATRQWLFGVAETALVHQDLACCARLYRALVEDDTEGFSAWDQELLAQRETRELWEEDQQMAAALKRLLTALEPEFNQRDDPSSFASVFAVICQLWGIECHQTLAAYAWIWFENQVAAAIKLVPLGQTDGQRLLLEFADRVDSLVVQAAALQDREVGYTLPRLAQLSVRHESQEFRLFRS